MAVSLDQTLGTNSGNQTNPNLTTTAAVAAGAHVFMCVGRFQTGALVSCSDDGPGLTWAEAVTAVASTRRASIWWAYAPSGMASGTTITVVGPGGTADTISAGISLLGIDTSGTIASSNNNNAASAASWSCGSITPTSGNALLGIAFQDGTTPCSSTATTGTEWVDLHVGGVTETLAGNYHFSPSGATNIGGNWSANATYTAVVAELKAAAGGGSPAERRLRVVQSNIRLA